MIAEYYEQTIGVNPSRPWYPCRTVIARIVLI